MSNKINLKLQKLYNNNKYIKKLKLTIENIKKY